MQSTEFEKWNAPGSEEQGSGRRSRAMLFTLKGLKAWGSGMIVMIMSVVFTMFMTEEYIEGMSVWEMAVVVLLLFPLALGVVQNWYWSKLERTDVESDL